MHERPVIYLDNAAAVPIHPNAVEAMAEAATHAWANPNSAHALGRVAAERLDRARMEVAEYLDCDPAELHWTSGGTSGLQRAMELGLSATSGPVASSRLEHPALLAVLDGGLRRRRPIHWLPTIDGCIDPGAAAPILAKSELIAVAAVNHEIGTVAPVEDLSLMAPDAVWVLDGVQSAPWIPSPLASADNLFFVCSSQKLGGPPGVGVVRIPARFRVDRPARSHVTPPSIAAIGMGAACRARQRSSGLAATQALARDLLAGLRSVRPDLAHNGASSWLGPILNISFPDADSRSLEASLDLHGVCVSRTAACERRRGAPSPVVAAAYPAEPWRADSAIRWSLGLQTTSEDVSAAVAIFRDVTALSTEKVHHAC